MQQKNHKKLLNFLGGLFAGICLSLFIGAVLLFNNVGQVYQPISSLLTETPVVFHENPTEQPIVQFTPLEEAEQALAAGQPEIVKELLYPAINSWTSNDDIIQGYRLLGEAEWAQGHPQLAVPYFEKLYFYQPTPENLFTLAAVYDAGGDNKNALQRYQELAKWENTPPEIDIEFVHIRIQNISRALGTPSPTFTPSN